MASEPSAWLQDFRAKGYAFPLPAFSEAEATQMVEDFRRVDAQMQQVGGVFRRGETGREGSAHDLVVGYAQQFPANRMCLTQAGPCQQKPRCRDFVAGTVLTRFVLRELQVRSDRYRVKVNVIAPWVDDIVRHPKILAYVKEILGPDVLMWTADFFCKVLWKCKTVQQSCRDLYHDCQSHACR